MPATIILDTATAREKAIAWIRKAPHACVMVLKLAGRTTDQNSRMWAMLTDVAAQGEHNGRKFTTEQWKCLFMHACKHEAHFMEGLNGEPFPAGFRTSQLSKAQMIELQDFIEYWAANNGVTFREKAA